MSNWQVTTRGYKCDHAKCDHVEFSTPTRGPKGFRGETIWVKSDGSVVSREWYACKHVHIRGAVYAVLLGQKVD